MKALHTRSLIVSLVAAFLLNVLAFAGGCAQEGEETTDAAVPKVVNIGVQTLVTPELAARYEGAYEEALGTEVNLIQFDGAAGINQAFASGSIDIGMMGSTGPASGIATGLDYEVFWLYDIIGEAEALVASPESGILTLSDLKGKKVATPFVCTTHYSLLKALEAEGIDVADIELLDMSPDDIYAAYKRGDIDAAYVWAPALAQLKADGARVSLDSAQLSEQGIVTADVAVVSKDFAEKYPDVVTDYVSVLINAVNHYNDDFDAALTSISQALELPEDEVKDQVAGFIYPDADTLLLNDYLGGADKVGNFAQVLKQTADFLAQQGAIDSAPALDVYEGAVTGRFIEAALTSAGDGE